MRTWLPPLRGELKLHSKEFGDLVGGPGGGYLVTDRFRESFRMERLTGLSGFQPVELVRVRGRRRTTDSASAPRYFYTTPVFGGAAVDESRSHIRRASPITCEACRETNVDTVHGFTLKKGTWRGEDVFYARGMTGSPVVSERFVHFVERHGLTNMLLVPTEEYTWDPLQLGPPRPVP